MAFFFFFKEEEEGHQAIHACTHASHSLTFS